MPAIYRLSRGDFARMRGFSRVQGTYFSLSYGDLPEKKIGFACVVSSKTASRAVDRNTIRRRCRSIVWEALKTAAPHTYVFIAKKGSQRATFSEIKTDIHTLFRRVRE